MQFSSPGPVPTHRRPCPLCAGLLNLLNLNVTLLLVVEVVLCWCVCPAFESTPRLCHVVAWQNVGFWLSMRCAETVLYVCCSDCAVATTSHLDSCLTHRRNTHASKSTAAALDESRASRGPLGTLSASKRYNTTQCQHVPALLQQTASPAGPCEHLKPHVRPPHTHMLHKICCTTKPAAGGAAA